MKLPESDIEVLRRLGERKRMIAEHPVNLERKAAWYALDSGARGRPMILAEAQSIGDETAPHKTMPVLCQDPWARSLEQQMRFELYQFDVLQDDHVIEPFMPVYWKVRTSDYGVPIVVHRSDNDGHLGAASWEPPIRDLDTDFARLKSRTFSVDRAASLADRETFEAVFRDVLEVRMRGSFYWSLGLTVTAVPLIGLENLMLFMYDNPEGLHRFMAFLRDDHLAFMDWLEQQGLYTLNNLNDYIGSGSMGYTRDLPAPDHRPGSPVGPRDLWALLESQETVGVGPELFEEFIYPYQRTIAERFGKVYYGCCEPLHTRWDVVRGIPNLARVSVSPWADEEFMARALGRDFVYSRKPAPSEISSGSFDEAAIRKGLRRTLEVARESRLEILMKDVHTLNNRPERLPRWVQLAREESARAGLA